MTDREKSYLQLLEIPPGYLNLMGYVDESAVNGPGCRAVIWVQGCLQKCPGCFNPSSQSFEINQLISVDNLVEKIISNPNHEGVTFSGGEPFWQASALADLARKLKAEGLNVMSYTGFTLERLQSEYAPAGSQDLLSQLDILIDGPYLRSQKINAVNSPVGSSNQRIHVFNPAFKNRINWASDETEIHFLRDGSRIVTDSRGQLFLAD